MSNSVVIVSCYRDCQRQSPAQPAPSCPQLSTDNISRWIVNQTKQNEKSMPFIHCISSFEGTSYKNLEEPTEPPDLSFIVACFYQLLQVTLA